MFTNNKVIEKIPLLISIDGGSSQSYHGSFFWNDLLVEWNMLCIYKYVFTTVRTELMKNTSNNLKIKVYILWDNYIGQVFVMLFPYTLPPSKGWIS